MFVIAYLLTQDDWSCMPVVSQPCTFLRMAIQGMESGRRVHSYPDR